MVRASKHVFFLLATFSFAISSFVGSTQIKVNQGHPEPLPTMTIDFTVPSVFFDFDRAVLSPASRVRLDSLVLFLKERPYFNVEVYSFTDSLEHNQMPLSQLRSGAVSEYLEEKGLEHDRIATKSFGARMPAAANTKKGKDNPRGRKLNRRTEFRIIRTRPNFHLDSAGNVLWIER
jgi:outer membrane protein OmpA-like peptidoglycan-associated protein